MIVAVIGRRRRASIFKMATSGVLFGLERQMVFDGVTFGARVSAMTYVIRT